MKFTEKEKEYLIFAIENRIRRLQNKINEEKKLINDKEYNKVKSIMINVVNDLSIPKNFKSTLIGIVRENYYYNIEERVEFYYQKNEIELLNLLKEEEQEIEFITDIEKLLNKLLSKNDKIPLLKDYLKTFIELSKLTFDKSFYSISGNKIYKIGIQINNKNLIHIELEGGSQLFPFSEINVNSGKQIYMYMKTNEELLNIFMQYGKENEPTVKMKFVIEVFKKQFILTNSIV